LGLVLLTAALAVEAIKAAPAEEVCIKRRRETVCFLATAAKESDVGLGVGLDIA